MDIFLLYLLMQADSIKGLFVAGAMVFGVVAGISYFICVIAQSDYEKELRSSAQSLAKRVMPFFIISIVIHALFPATKTLAVMVGGHYAIEATKSETAKKIMTLVDATLDKALAKVK